MLIFWIGSILIPHVGVLPVAEGLNYIKVNVDFYSFLIIINIYFTYYLFIDNFSGTTVILVDCGETDID